MLTMMNGDPYKAYNRNPERLGKYGLMQDWDGIHVFRMCKVTVATSPGEVVGPAAALATGTVTSAVAVGGKTIPDTGNFSALTDDDFIGATGETIGALAVGGGQLFEVLGRPDDDTLQVRVIWASTAAAVVARVTNGGFSVALTTATTYSVALPGRTLLAIADQPAIGVSLIEVGTTDPYFFAKVTGLAPVLVLNSASNILINEGVAVSATAGRVEGIDATSVPLAIEQEAMVGRAQASQNAGFDQAIWVELDINGRWAASLRPGRDESPWRKVDVV